MLLLWKPTSQFKNWVVFMLNFHLSNLFFPLPLGNGIFSDICWLKSAQKGEIVVVFIRLAKMELLLFLL